MSQWRRIAIEQIPSCKNIVEQADHPVALWFCLYHELQGAYARQPLDIETIRQIYKFAIWAVRNRKNSSYQHLTGEVWAFYENLIVECGSDLNRQMTQDLPHQLPASIFESEVNNFSYLLTEEETRALKQVYSAARHKPK